MQSEIAAIHGEQDTFGHQLNENSPHVDRRPVPSLEFGGDLRSPPCPRPLFSDDPECSKGHCCRRRQEAWRKVDVLGWPFRAGAKYLVDPRMTEARQLADATMGKSQRRDPTHGAFTSLLRRRKRGFDIGLDCRVIGLSSY